MAINYAMPRMDSPVVDKDGRMSRDWYLFLSALFNSVGGKTPVAPGSVDLSLSNDLLTARVVVLEKTAGVTIPAQPTLIAGGVNYKFILGQGWVLA